MAPESSAASSMITKSSARWHHAPFSSSISCSIAGTALVSSSSRVASMEKNPEDESPHDVGISKCLNDPYDPVTNPNGVVQLGIAENRLTMDLVKEWISENVKASFIHSEIADLVLYHPLDGLLELKTALAALMGQVMLGSTSFDPSHMIITSGATSAIETLTFCLADPGDAVLIPSPYYSGYDMNVNWRAGVEIIPVPCRSIDNFRLSISSLELAYNQAKKRGINVRAIFLSNPSNPIGNLIDRETMYELLDFVTEKNIHLVSDEVFAGSNHGTDEFVSIADVAHTQGFDRTKVHIIYGVSKVLSLPGFRIGVICSFNENVLATAKKFARFFSVSVPTQRLLVSMLSDVDFVQTYIEIKKKRLRRMYELFVDGLKQLDIECFPSSAGYYCWADMSKLMRSNSEEGELELWDQLLNISMINVSPGSECHCVEHGWFRICFTTITEDDIPIVMERIKRII